MSLKEKCKELGFTLQKVEIAGADILDEYAAVRIDADGQADANQTKEAN